MGMNLIEKNYTLKTYYLKDDGVFPNNKPLPVLHYKGILHPGFLIGGWQIRKLFEKNNWTNSWRDGLYDFNHYHSNTHEVIGVCKGKTTVLLGGEKGKKLPLSKAMYWLFLPGWLI